MAAGLTILPENIDSFRQALDAYADSHLTEEDYIPLIELTAELSPEEITRELVTELEKLEPYGMSNPRPLFGCFNIHGTDAKLLGREGKHLKFSIKGGNESLEAIGWNMSDKIGLVNRDFVDIAFVPEIREWYGREFIQCKMSDLRSSENSHPRLTREILVKIYVVMRKIQNDDGILPDTRKLADQCGVDDTVMESALQVFGEIGLIFRENSGLRMAPPPKNKLRLEDSKTYREYAVR